MEVATSLRPLRLLRASREACRRLLSATHSSSSGRVCRVSHMDAYSGEPQRSLITGSIVAKKQGAVSLTTFDVAHQLRNTKQPTIVAFYRGLPFNLVASSAAWGAFFGFKNLAFNYLVSTNGNMTTTPFIASQRIDWNSFGAAFFAGVATQVVTNPLFVVKIRIMETDKCGPDAYPNAVTAFKTMWRQEGLKTFWKGTGISTVASVQGALMFSMYDPMTKSHRQRGNEGQNGTLSILATLAYSAYGKSISTAITYPYQVVRSRLQARGSEAKFGKGIRGVASQLWKEAGIRGFYKGLFPNICKTLPGTWATFVAYEQLKPYLTKRWLEDGSNEYREP